MMKYTMTWQDYKGNTCLLCLENTNIDGADVQLTPAHSPFVTIEDVDSNPFVPYRNGSAKISFVSKMDESYPEAKSAHDWGVTLLVGNDKKWRGFLNSDSLSQPFEPDTHEITINANNCIKSLASWSLDEDAYSGISTVRDILIECFDHIADNDTELLFADVMSTSANGNVLSLLDLQIDRHVFYEQNDDMNFESQSCLSVMSNICAFLGLSLRQVGSSFVFSRIGYGRYVKTTYASIKSGLYSYNVISANPVSGFNLYNDNNNITNEKGYRKISITNDIKKYSFLDINLIPNKTKFVKKVEDNLYAKLYFGYLYDNLDTSISMSSYGWENGTYHVRENNFDIFKSNQPNNYCSACYAHAEMLTAPLFEEDTRTNHDMHYGIFVCENCIDRQENYPSFEFLKTVPMITFKKKNAISYTKGGFIINATFRTFERNIWNRTFKIMFRIGNKYWNGSNWTSEESYFDADIHEVSQSDRTYELYDTKTLEMDFSGSGTCMPINEELSGDIEVRFLYFGKCLNQIYVIDGIEIKYCESLSSLQYDTNQYDYTISEKNEMWENDLDEVTLYLSSSIGDMQNHSHVMTDSAPITTLYECGTAIRPERALLNAMNDHFSKSRTVINAKSKTDYIDSVTDYIVIAGKKYDVISASNVNWRTNEAELILKDYE